MRPETTTGVPAANSATKTPDLSDPTRAADWPAALRLPKGTRATAVAVASTTVIR